MLKHQSTSLAWLVLRDAERAYIGGTATISGTDGEVPFVATVHDGSATGGSDRFAIKVYAPGANPAVDRSSRPPETRADRFRSRAKVPALARRQMLARSDDAHHAQDG